MLLSPEYFHQITLKKNLKKKLLCVNCASKLSFRANIINPLPETNSLSLKIKQISPRNPREKYLKSQFIVPLYERYYFEYLHNFPELNIT